MCIEQFVMHSFDPSRGQIRSLPAVFYKHVMPPASICCSSIYRNAAPSSSSMAISTARLAVSSKRSDSETTDEGRNRVLSDLGPGGQFGRRHDSGRSKDERERQGDHAPSPPKSILSGGRLQLTEETSGLAIARAAVRSASHASDIAAIGA